MPRDVSPASASPSFDAGRASGLNSGGFGGRSVLPSDRLSSLLGGREADSHQSVRAPAGRPVSGLALNLDYVGWAIRNTRAAAR